MGRRQNCPGKAWTCDHEDRREASFLCPWWNLRLFSQGTTVQGTVCAKPQPWEMQLSHTEMAGSRYTGPSLKQIWRLQVTLPGPAWGPVI